MLETERIIRDNQRKNFEDSIIQLVEDDIEIEDFNPDVNIILSDDLKIYQDDLEEQINKNPQYSINQIESGLEFYSTEELKKFKDDLNTITNPDYVNTDEKLNNIRIRRTLNKENKKKKQQFDLLINIATLLLDNINRYLIPKNIASLLHRRLEHLNGDNRKVMLKITDDQGKDTYRPISNKGKDSQKASFNIV